MMDCLILLSNMAAAGVRGVICFFLIFRLLSSSRPGKKGVLSVLAGITVLSVILTVTGMSDFYRMVSETVLIVVCASRFQRADTRMSLFISIFYEIALSFWQFLFSAWAGVLFSSPAFLDSRTGYGQIAVWLLHLVLAALAWYVFKHPDMTGERAFRSASVIAMAGFLTVVTLSQQTALAIPDDTLEMWTILAVVLIMSVLVFNVNRQYEMEKELAALKSQQAELLERDYTTLNHAYAVNAKLFHDFHNHMGVLRQLLTHKKAQEAMQYLDELQTPIREMTNTVWTGDETIDYLINSKAMSAQENKIEFQAQAEFPRHTSLRSADLCAVLGNLLDNALEAARQIPEPKQRFIHLTIRRINQMLVIKVENSFVTAPIEADGALKTSKDRDGLHGWGLKSAQTAAEKYDGMVQTSYSENTFRAVAVLSYQNLKICTKEL